jgi:polar amino acid transport system substrate-binding protein
MSLPACRSPFAVFTIVLIGLLTASGAHTQQTPSPQDSLPPAEQPDDRPVPITIATRDTPPFAIRGADGQSWSGITIELIRQIAEEMGYEVSFQEMGLTEMIDAVADEQLDAAAAAITITAEREERVDFTHPFYTSGLGVAVQRQPALSPLALLGRFTNAAFLEALLALLAVLTLVGAAMWLVERRRNAEQFPDTPVKGIGAGLWWSAVTMTTVGYGDKAPVTLLGRVFGLIWMFASIIIISGFTAAIATSLTVNQLAQSITGVDDLRSKRVVTVAASTSSQWLDEQLVRYRAAESVGDALDALSRGEADALVYDLPILQYLVRDRYSNGIRVLPNEFARQDYGIALRSGAPLREEVNREILRITEEPAWADLLARYLGPEGN